MRDLTIQEYQDLLMAAQKQGRDVDSLKTKLALNGYTIGGIPIRPPGTMGAVTNIEQQTSKYDLLGPSSRRLGDALPGLAAGFAGGINPTAIIRKGVGGALLRAGARIGLAGAAGAGGELIRENIYRGTGETAPPSPAAELMGQLGVPTQPLQEGVAQAGMQAIAEPVGAGIKAFGKVMMKVPGKNLRFDAAQEALDQNIPLNMSGIKILKERAQPLYQQRLDALAAHTRNGKMYHVDQDILDPVLTNLAYDIEGTNMPDEAESIIGRLVRRWKAQQANQGIQVKGTPTGYLAPTRIAQIMQDASQRPGVKVRYTKRQLGAMTPEAQTQASLEAQFYRELADRARHIINTDMPDIGEINDKLARNQNLQDAIRRNEGGKIPPIVLRHLGMIAGGAAAAAVEPAENNQERIKHAVGWAALTEAMSTPRGINFLAEALRQSPRIANTLASWAAPDATQR